MNVIHVGECEALSDQQKNFLQQIFQIRSKISDKQLILLYLKFESPNINYEDFRSAYKITYDSYKSNINHLKKDQIIREVNKNTRFQTYKLNHPDVQVFPYATKSDELIIYKYLHSTNDNCSDQLTSYINIILYPKSLNLLNTLKNSESKIFREMKKTAELNHLIQNNVVLKIPNYPKTYTLTESYNDAIEALEQTERMKNPPIINKDLHSILRDTTWNNIHNVHDLHISVKLKGLYDDLRKLPEYRPLQTNNKLIKILDKFKISKIDPRIVTVTIYKHDDTIINISCSENSIPSNNLGIINSILAQVIEYINKVTCVDKQTENFKYAYTQKYKITKHDFAIDGTVPYRLRKRMEFKYKNNHDQTIFFYVKENYKDTNSSWVRYEDRSNRQHYDLDKFKSIIRNEKLDVMPSYRGLIL